MLSAAQLAQKLLQIKAIKLRPQTPFTWASGIKSPIYCDNRITLSHPIIRNEIKAAFADKAGNYAQANCIAGVATAGVAHGALLADALDLPYVYVRSKAKAHGRQNLIEGELPENAKVIVVEDLISTGGSSIQAVKALREAGAEVLVVFAIFTYGFQKAEDNFKEVDCPFISLSNYEALLAEAESSSYISESEKLTLEEWNAAPETWYDKYF
ncbi:MAG: orotate phosphoribosyltransferase [Saprospiraceae bacterium]|nr:orotate phosphoribosyltransferase [Saprospiraceae bacterium]